MRQPLRLCLCLLLFPAAAQAQGQPLRDDIGRLLSPPALVAVAAGIGAGAALSPLDGDLRFRLRRRPLRLLLDAAEPYGAKEIVFPAAVGLWLGGKAGDRPGLQRLGSELGRALLLSNALVGPLKLAVDRRRPDGSARSFPSGHAGNAFAASGVLARRYGRRAGLPLYALSALVAAQRIHAGRHFAGDVVTGAVLGATAGWAVGLEGLHASANGRGAALVWGF